MTVLLCVSGDDCSEWFEDVSYALEGVDVCVLACVFGFGVCVLVCVFVIGVFGRGDAGVSEGRLW